MRAQSRVVPLLAAVMLIAGMIALSPVQQGMAILQAQSQSTPTPFPKVTANSQWKPVERDFDGVTMVQVPAGCFMMGSASGGDDNERPVTRICFDAAFWLDKTEVTQGQFKRLRGKAARNPGFPGDNRPVEMITWFEARDFCAKRGARLPTEAEWEYAARGPDNLTYPWGNTFVADNVVFLGNSNAQTANAGSKPNGASWVGALDLSGNVQEWMSSLYKPYPYQVADGRENSANDIDPRTTRYGSWDLTQADVFRAAFRRGAFPQGFGTQMGFRCAGTFESAGVSATPAATAAPTLAASSSQPGQTTVTRNADWKPVERDFDGVTMVQVPAGCFQMGTASGGGDNERPVTRICFDAAFWLDKTEVTQGQFKRLGGQAAKAPGFPGDNRPVETITWFEARDFCTKRGARLPTEAEWEYAARGPDNLVYPWGNTWDASKASWKRSSSEGDAEVGSKPAGVSWVGALDLSGNVLEWVNSLYRPYPYAASDGRESSSDTSSARVVRSGAWASSSEDSLLAAHRIRVIPNAWNDSIGFRCARSS